MAFPFDLDPHARDPGGWATSMLHNAEFVLACLDAARARTICEVGGFQGELTELLLRRGAVGGGRLTVVDTAPHAELRALADARDDAELTLWETDSHSALREIELPDAIVLDGDHNYWTVAGELSIIAERYAAAERSFPLVLMHDVGWPHDRRDDYYVPENVPAEHRHPLAEDGLFPGNPDTVHGGIPFDHPAAREGGPRNGVLTAVEDFLAERGELRLAIVPSFFGLGVIWDVAGPHAEAIEQTLAPWDRNVLLQRMEDNRILHLANTHVLLIAAQEAQERVVARDRQLQRQTELLTAINGSRVFWAVQLLLRLRHGRAVVSPRQMRGAIT
jgi:hypothetical protein